MVLSGWCSRWHSACLCQQRVVDQCLFWNANTPQLWSAVYGQPSAITRLPFGELARETGGGGVGGGVDAVCLYDGFSTALQLACGLYL
jgi:hypothetical protein